MTKIQHILSLDWKDDFDQILSQIQTKHVPFKVTSFFSPEDTVPRSNNDFYKAYPEMPLEIVNHSYAEFFKNAREEKYKPPEKSILTLGEFVRKATQDLSFRENSRCYENFIPNELVPFADKKLRFENLSGKTDHRHEPSFYYRFFLGFKDQTTHPHLDWNCNNNILFQVYGRKKVFIFSPETFVHFEFSLHFVENSLEELLQIMTKTGIPYYEIDLNEGEGLHIPPYFLHSVLYPSDSCSLALRFLPRKQNIKIHRLLPANNKLALLLDKWHQSGIDYSDKIEQFCSIKKYSELLKSYERCCEETFDRNIIPKTSLHSQRYEEYIFNHQQSFDYQIQVRRVRKEILDRGASYFSF